MTHPYPKDVVEAVAKALMKSSEGRDAFGAGGDWDAAGHTIKQEFLDHATTALQTLWDASRVDNVEQLGALPYETTIVEKRGIVWTKTPKRERMQCAGWLCSDSAMYPGVYGDHLLGSMALPANIIYWGDRD